MTITCSICGKPVSLEEIREISLENDTIVKICNMVRKRMARMNTA